MRNPSVIWSHEARREDDARVILLKLPRRGDRLGNLVARWFRLPEYKKIELDPLGSDVWEMCDGRTSVEQITRAVCTTYHMNKRQAEASVTAFLRMLAERRLIGLKNASPSSAAKASAKAKGAAPVTPATAAAGASGKTAGKPATKPVTKSAVRPSHKTQGQKPK